MFEKTRTVLVTGATKGIGLAAATAFAESGWRVLATGRDEMQLDNLRQQFEQRGLETFPCDMLRHIDRQNLAEWVTARTGLLHAIVHNAGAGRFVSLEKTDTDLWANTLELNLTAPMHLTRELLPLLERAEGDATCICISSIAAIKGFPMCTSYAAAKGGLLAWANALREEMRGRMKVSVLLPGPTDSKFWDVQEGEWDRSRMMSCRTIGETILQIANLPAEASMEQVNLLPSGGTL